MTDRRPNPDRLLRELGSTQAAVRGRLKIFFGYAAGVGKTYDMLDAAHRAQKAGVDLLAGYIEPHTRPETIELLEGLERLEPLTLSYRGITLREFDLDGALVRRPQLVLVDELAHSNAEGCRHRKRYQDIEELLRAGIDVYTTMNVQHLESLNDMVSSLTGVVVGERVPDRIFDSADQVELVDIEPEELIERLEAGKSYREKQAEQALEHFFTPENLAALREIALRRTADRLNRSARSADGRSAPAVGEHVLICLSSAPSNARVIRTAARMAEAFHSDFTALFVESPSTRELHGESLRRLRANLKLAEELGAKIATVYGDDPAVQIAEYARVSGVSKIVLGRTNHWRKPFSKVTLVDRMTELAPDLDVYIIPDKQPVYRPESSVFGARLSLSFSWVDCLKTVCNVALATMVGWLFDLAGLSDANIITVYILGVLLTSVWTGEILYGAAASLASVVIFNYLFTDPRFTLLAYDPGYPVTFLVMLVASILTSTLTMRIKNQAQLAAGKAYRTEALLQTSQRLQKAEDQDQILEVTALQLFRLLDRPIVLYPSSNGVLSAPRVYPAEQKEDGKPFLGSSERTVAEWVLRNNKHAGAATNTLPGSACLYLAVRGESAALAVAAIPMRDSYPEPDSFEKNLMLAMLDECGLALEKERLRSEKQQIEAAAQQEALRANLLRAISHDLRTPLTSISGNAGILIESADALSPEKKRKLYADIYEDSVWLVNLVENLLSITRIENGAMRLKLEPELLDDVFREAQSHLDKKSAEHTVTAQLDDDLLMAEMDAGLVVQVIVNLLNNAVKYTPRGSHILLSAHRVGRRVEVSVTDDGPGVPDETKGKLFDMFYTADNIRGDGRRGLGLGLSLCKSIVEAHGGSIVVRDHLPHGASFVFTLPYAEVQPYE